jgi:hypothetical protein
MTGNSKEIKKLKYQQAKKQQSIKRYKRKRKKNLLYITGFYLISTALLLDFAYGFFGSSVNFLIVTFSVFIVLIVSYTLVIRYLVKQLERDIKIIRTKLYKLMKLNQ